MKSIILSCTPFECEKIVNGDMSILVRKVVPKEVPFKIYIYETKGNKIECGFHLEDTGITLRERYVYGMHKAKIVKHYRYEGKSRVIGEFICNTVDEYPYDYCDGVDIDDDTILETAIEREDINIYAKGKPLYGLHISDLKIYDEPKELSEFYATCKYKNTDGTCRYCRVSCYYQRRDYNQDGSINLVECGKKVSRPPKNYIYVEE